MCGLKTWFLLYPWGKAHGNRNDAPGPGACQCISENEVRPTYGVEDLLGPFRIPKSSSRNIMWTRAPASNLSTRTPCLVVVLPGIMSKYELSWIKIWLRVKLCGEAPND